MFMAPYHTLLLRQSYWYISQGPVQLIDHITLHYQFTSRSLAFTEQKHTFPPPWKSIGYVLETY